MSDAIDELLTQFGDDPYTRDQYDKDLDRILTRLCDKHGVTTQADVNEIIKDHRYEHTTEDPEDEYIILMAMARHNEWL